MKAIVVKQKRVDSLIKKLLDQIDSSGCEYTHVVGIREGGLNISLPIAKALNLPHHSLKISFYLPDGTGSDTYYCRQPVVESEGFSWREGGLLVDDLIDQGRTIDYFQNNFGKADVAVLFWNKMGDRFYRKTPKYYGEEKPSGWIVFPWDIE